MTTTTDIYQTLNIFNPALLTAHTIFDTSLLSAARTLTFADSNVNLAYVPNQSVSTSASPTFVALTAGSITSSGALSCNSLSVAGAFSPQSVNASGAIVGGTVTSSGSISGASVAATGAITSLTYTASGAIVGGSITSSGALSCDSLSVSGTFSPLSVNASGAIVGGTVTSSGSISGASVLFNSSAMYEYESSVAQVSVYKWAKNGTISAGGGTPTIATVNMTSSGGNYMVCVDAFASLDTVGTPYPLKAVRSVYYNGTTLVESPYADIITNTQWALEVVSGSYVLKLSQAGNSISYNARVSVQPINNAAVTVV